MVQELYLVCEADTRLLERVVILRYIYIRTASRKLHLPQLRNKTLHGRQQFPPISSPPQRKELGVNILFEKCKA